MPRRVAAVLGLLLGLAACGPATKVVLPPLLASPRPPAAPPAPDGEPVFVPQRTSTFQTLLWSPDGRFAVMQYQERRALVVDLETGHVRGAWDLCLGRLALAAFRNDRFYFGTCDAREVGHVGLDRGVRIGHRVPLANLDNYFGLSVSPRGDIVYLGNATKGGFLDAASGAVRYAWPTTNGPRDAAIAPDGKAFALARPDDVSVVEPDGTPRWSLRLAEDSPPRMAWSADGALLAIRTRDEISLLAARDGQVVARRNPCKPGSPTAMTPSPAGRRLLVGCRRQESYRVVAHAVLLDFTLAEQEHFADSFGELGEVRFTPDGRRASATLSGGQVVVLEIASGRTSEGPTPCESGACKAAWSPGLDRVLATRFVDGVEVHTLYDAGARELLRLGAARLLAPVPRAQGAPAPPPSPARPEPPPAWLRSLDGRRGANAVSWQNANHEKCTTAELCWAVEVIDVASGKRLFKLPLSYPPASQDGFSGDGERLLVGGTVFDVAGGVALRAIDPVTRGQARWLGRTPRLLITLGQKLTVVEPTSGAVGPEVQGITDLVDITDDGTVLARTATGDVLFDPVSGALRPPPPCPTAQTAGGFERSAGFLRCETRGSAMFAAASSVLRIADGRLLRSEGALAVTDEGVFDGPPESWCEGSFRMGPDVLHNRMVPLAELAPRFHHPGLKEAFFAGAAVSPMRP